MRVDVLKEYGNRKILLYTTKSIFWIIVFLFRNTWHFLLEIRKRISHKVIIFSFPRRELRSRRGKEFQDGGYSLSGALFLIIGEKYRFVMS